MDIVLIFSERWKMTPFEILDEDVDRFITMFNYFINLEGEETPEQTNDEKEEAAAFWAAV